MIPAVKSYVVVAAVTLASVAPLIAAAPSAGARERFDALYGMATPVAAWPTEAELADADYRRLFSLSSDLDAFAAEMLAIQTELGSTPILSTDLDERLRAAFAGYLRVQRVLLRLADDYRPLFTEEKQLFGQMLYDGEPTLLQKRVRVGYGAALFLFSSVTRQTAAFGTPGHMLWRKLDEADPTNDLPAGELSRLWRVVTKGRNVRKLAQARRTYLEVYPEAAKGEQSVDWLHRRIAREHALLDANAPSFWTTTLLQVWQTITTGFHKPYYRICSAVSIWVGDTKYVHRPPAIGHDRVAQMTARLEPGDILLERENWYLSNAFLPGFWPHGIMYVGTVEDLQAMGLTEDPRVAPHLAAHAAPDHMGFPHRVLEAISPGVVMSSMEEATDADYIAAFRPRLSPEAKKEAIARAFAHVGKPYDFSFDFATADKLVCTELVYRAYDRWLNFPLAKVAGHWALTATEIIATYERERGTDGRQLDFVFFLDSNHQTGATWFADDDALIASKDRPGLAFLFKDERP